jgi:hypothetical protein
MPEVLRRPELGLAHLARPHALPSLWRKGLDSVTLDSLGNAFQLVAGLTLTAFAAVMIGMGWRAERRQKREEPHQEAQPRPCPKCGGDRNFIVYTSQGSGPCPFCQGRGTVNW